MSQPTGAPGHPPGNKPGSPAPPPVLRLHRRTAPRAAGEARGLPLAQPVPAVVRPHHLSYALFIWPSLSSTHAATALSLFERCVAALRDRLGLRLEPIPALVGKRILRNPESRGLVRADASGAYHHPAADVTVLFRPLPDLPAQTTYARGGITAGGSASPGPRRFAAVDVSRVLASSANDPEQLLYYSMLHALLAALARLPTRHSDGWGGAFLVPSPNCDREYRYPGAYGPTEEERTRGAAEGWKNYLEAILNGTAVRYVPLFDDLVVTPPAAPPTRPGPPTASAPDTVTPAPSGTRKKTTV